MKQIKSVILLLIVCVLAFNSCKKSNTKPKVAAQSISLKFNGTAYTSATPVASYSKSQNALQIIGTFGTTGSIYLIIPSGVKVGSFDMATNAGGATFTGANALDPYFGITGNIVITSFTSITVSGTFQFTGTDQSNVTGTATGGQFQANYTTTQ